MSVLKVLGGIACVSVFVGSGALAEMGGTNAAGAIDMLEKQSEAKSPNAAKAVKKLKQHGKGERPHTDAAKTINEFTQQGNANMGAIGGEPLPVEDLAQQTRKGGSKYFN